MATEDPTFLDRIVNVINRHGHPFQYAVIRNLDALFRTRQQWAFEVAEFPVQSQHGDTRIDFILRPQVGRFFLVCECKRANPSLKHWCFVRAPYVRRNRSVDFALVEWHREEYEGGHRHHLVQAAKFGAIRNVYHLGYEIKDPRETGDPGNGKGAIDLAAAQAFRGVHGLLALRAAKNRTTAQDPVVNTYLMPILFTTATLWALATDLGTASLSTGEVSAVPAELSEVPWLYWQYPVSASLRTRQLSPEASLDFGELLESHYLRTVAVVNESGIEAFFDQFRVFDDSPTAIPAARPDAT